MSYDVGPQACAPAIPQGGKFPTATASVLRSVSSPIRQARSRLPDTLLDLLVGDSAAPGVILLGEPGSGKTALLRSLVDRLRSTACLIHLRGSGRGAEEPYGVLRILLDGCGENLFSHPVRVISVLTRVLRNRARGLPVIVVVDDTNFLDDHSATVLGQLVQAGTIRLIAACNDLKSAPEYFQTLCRKGSLVRVELGPLSQQEVAGYLGATLGAAASRASSFILHTRSEGNPRLLRALVADYLAAGALRCVGGVWVLTADTVPPGEATASLMTDRLATLKPSQRTLLGALASAGTTPLAALPTEALSDLDELQEQGMLAFGSDRWATVSVASSLLSDAVLGRTTRVDVWNVVPEPKPHLPGQLAESPVDVRRLRAETILKRARQAAFEGYFPQVVNELTSEEFHPGALDPENRQLAAAWLSEALAFTGRVDDAKEAAAVLQPRHPGQAPLPSRIAVTLAALEAVSGNLTGMLEVSAQHLRGRGPGTGTYEELAEGLIFAAAGRPAEAAPLLLPALRQLQVHDPAGVAPLAAAALAFISAPDAPALAADYLLMANLPSRTASWTARRLTKHFAALALSGAVSAERSAFELRELSRQDRKLGNRSWELMTLCGAMRQGDSGVAQALVDLSATCQGRFAALCQAYAAGVEADDAELVLHAMDLAQHLGDLSLAGDAATTAEHITAQSGDRAAAGKVAERVRGVIGLTGTALGARQQLASLTRREVEVVTALVDGKSNRDLALAMDVSVRTVEGHLHRAYTKLHVRTKAELLAKVSLGTASRR